MGGRRTEGAHSAGEGPDTAEVIFEYRPARLGPMTVALAFILALATPVAAGERVLAGRLDETALAMAPLALLGLFAWLASRSPLRVSAERIDVPRSRLARALGARTGFALADVENLYPTYYEDIGMRLSPFASAEGTAKHAGLAVEASDGKRVVIEFTPTVLNLRRHGTEPYHAALAALRQACARAGRPLVKKSPSLTQAQAETMLIEAARPLLPFPVTVAGILAPSALIPGLVWGLGRVLGPLPPGAVLVAALVGLAPLIAVFAFVNLKSRRRADLLHEVQKWREHGQETEARAPSPAQS